MPERLLPRRVRRAPRSVRGLQHRVDRDDRAGCPSSGRHRSGCCRWAERPVSGETGQGVFRRDGRGAPALVEGDRQDALADGADVLAVPERRVGPSPGALLLARQRDGLRHARSARELLLQPVRVIFCWAGIETSRVDASLAQNVSSRRSRRVACAKRVAPPSRRLVGAKSIRESAGRS